MEDSLSSFDKEILKQMEDVAIKLYNKLDYECTRDICSIMQDIYINKSMVKDAKRFQEIIKKLNIIENYMETNRDIFMRNAMQPEEEE